MTKDHTNSIYFAAAAFVLVLAGTAWLHASPQQQEPTAATYPQSVTHAIGSPVVTPSTIVVNTPTLVTVTISIPDPTLISGSVNLLRLGPTGTQPVVLGVMQSTGGGIYILQKSFSESSAGQIQLEVSAGFRGSLRRVTSNPIVVSVYNTYTDSSVGVSVHFPASLYLVPPPSGVGQQVLLQSTPRYIGIGEAFDNPTPDQEPVTGYVISISSAPYNVQPFDINTYIATDLVNYSVASITPITAAGVSAYRLIFNDAHAPKPLVIIPRGTMVYEASYNSTLEPNAPEETSGLDNFNNVLQHLQFLR